MKEIWVINQIIDGVAHGCKYENGTTYVGHTTVNGYEGVCHAWRQPYPDGLRVQDSDLLDLNARVSYAKPMSKIAL